MLRMVLKKMLRNRWLVACLLAGTVIAVALVSSIPMYTQGTLQRLITRDLETFQEQMNMFPGRYTVSVGFIGITPDSSTGFPFYDETVRRRVIGGLGLPVLASTCKLTVDYLQAVPAVQREEFPASRFMRLEALEGAAAKVKIVQGRMAAAPPAGTAFGATEIEAVVTEQALVAHDLRVGEAYTVSSLQGSFASPVTVRVVGTFRVADPGDPWWYLSLRNYDDTFLADHGWLKGAIADPPTPVLSGAAWSFALDYHAVTVSTLAHLLRTLEGQVALLDANGASWDLPMLDILRAYQERERQVVSVLWFLQVPVLLMLAFYVYMVSLLIIGAEANEIAVLKSRGASAAQIFVVYLLEGLVTAAAGMAAGIPLGLLVCRVVGATNGFMEFVQRAGIGAEVNARALVYGGAAAAIMLAATLVPALAAARTTIVLFKQRRSRLERAPLWRRMFLDVILVGLSAYGWYGYRTQKLFLVVSGLKASTLPVDPILFLISTFFVIGVGLAFLRLYPLLVRLLYRLGRRAWPPALYVTFVGVGRSGGREQFLMLFLIMTLAIGILNAKAARTINRNAADTIGYTVGADIVLTEEWRSNLFTPDPSMPAVPMDTPRGDVTAASGKAVTYHETDFSRFTALPGVQAAAKVFRKRQAQVRAGTETVTATLLAVDPREFTAVADFPEGLLPAHPNAYMNLLLSRTDAVLVSQGFAAKYRVARGDAVGITWPGGGYVSGVVAGLVQWWPTYNPYTTDRAEATELVVASLSHVQLSVGVQPYEVWIRKAPGAPSAAIYSAIEGKGAAMKITSFTDATQQLVAARNDAVLQGTNGALTLGFMVTLVVSTIGFLIYWIISIQGRLLQFGVFRAMGLGRASILGMVAAEQVLISLVAVLAGIFIGGLAGDLFVPLLELTRSASQQVPPFRIIADRGDYVRIYAFAGGMLAVCFAALGLRIMRIRMAQAIKLGEE